jgi:hypothetical protein
LIECFQQGIQNEAALLFALQNRRHSALPPPECDVVRKVRSPPSGTLRKAS